MIWEQNVCRVVMLGKIRENGKDKCYKYWPDVNVGETYGELSVTCQRIVTRAHFIFRELYLYDHQKAEKRIVVQYQFTSWPDGKFPAPPLLASFIKQVNKVQIANSSIVVHCSNGIGRTGTFIAIRALAEHARAQTEVDVFKFVCKMRKNRPEMVQTRGQYVGLHRTLYDMVVSKDTMMNNLKFMERYRHYSFKFMSETGTIAQEFKTLKEMKPVLSAEETHMALRPENISQNRSIHIVPGFHHIELSGTVSKPGRYVNAVSIPSVLHKRGFIVTQQPFYHSIEQFWTLIQEQESVTIVSLTTSNTTLLKTKDYGEYIPRKTGETLSVGKFEILLKSISNTHEDVTEKTLILKTRGEDNFTPSRHVKLFSIPDWLNQEQNQSKRSILLGLLECLVRRQKEAGQHPIVVQCLDGASRSGLFCAASNIISRIRMDKEVDIFLSVRELQCIRPAFIPSLSQYSFCYELARNYMKNTEH